MTHLLWMLHICYIYYFSLRKRHFISASRGPTSWRAHHKVLSIAKLVFVLLDRCTWRVTSSPPINWICGEPSSPQKGLKKGIPSRELTSHQTGKGKSSTQNAILGGYVSFLEGIYYISYITSIPCINKPPI